MQPLATRHAGEACQTDCLACTHPLIPSAGPPLCTIRRLAPGAPSMTGAPSLTGAPSMTGAPSPRCAEHDKHPSPPHARCRSALALHPAQQNHLPSGTQQTARQVRRAPTALVILCLCIYVGPRSPTHVRGGQATLRRGHIVGACHRAARACERVCCTAWAR